jgi:hypothetical protein
MEDLPVDSLSGGILVFLVVFVAAVLLLGGFAIAVYRGARNQRR